MKHYPPIPKEVRQDIPVIVQDKIDCSLRGDYKFGTKNQMTDEKTMPFGRAIPLLKEKYEADLAMVFKEQDWRDAICFFELWGKDSFAGSHNFEKPMDITLFDVNPYKLGILVPAEFVRSRKRTTSDVQDQKQRLAQQA